MKTRLFRLSLALAFASAPCGAQGIIKTVAGSATCCNSADGGQATNTWLPGLGGITLDTQGNFYIWDGASSKVRKVNTSGVITTVAGNGTPGYAGDGGPATNAELFSSGSSLGLAVDAAGNVYISDGQNHVIRKVSTAGIITTIAGNGTSGFLGDGGPATAAELNFPAGIVLDSAGNLYIADSSNSRVRKVNSAGIISTFAGNGNVVYSGDGVQATATAVNRPEGLAIDSAGNLYISETSDSRVRRVAPGGIISTIAGQTKKTNGFSGDGGPATSATFAGPIGLAVDRSGNLYIADNSNGRVRKVDAAGTITTVAGITGTASTLIGDGGPSTSAYLGVPVGVAIDASGNLFIGGSAAGIHRVREVTASASLSTTPSALSFSYTIGGASPASQSVSVSGSGGALSFTATASITSNGNWLSVSPGSGSTPATLTVSVNPAGLPGGVYQGAVTLTPTGSAPQSFAITLTVTGAGAPVFSSSGVLNALGYQAKLAPDTVFVIFGSGMGPATLAAASAPNYPSSLGGTSITFTPTSGGAAITAKMVYAVAGQIAGLLPSSVTPGTYAVRVTYNTLASAPQNVTVVARSFGIATSNSAGTGTAQATIGNINGGLSLTRFTSGNVAFGGYTWTLSPGHPGDTLVLWGTGGGADAANDVGGSSGDQTKAGNFSVIVSGRPITPLYAGASSGFPGLWQINFTLPSDIGLDCFAPVQVSAGGELSNVVSVPIAASGQGACSDSQLSQDALARLDAGGSIVIGGLAVAKQNDTSTYIRTPGGTPTTIVANQESISGNFGSYSAVAYAAIFSGTRIGACVVNSRTAPATTPNPATPDGYLDAGSSLPVSGPGLTAAAALGIVSNNPGPLYDLLLTNGTITAGGKYTITGNGGKGIGPFSASTTFPSSFSVANWDSLTTIDRTKPLVLNWAGSGFDQVTIIGSTYGVVGKDSSNTNIIQNVSFTCQVPAAPGTYTIPTAVLSYLLPAGIDLTSPSNVVGLLTVETSTSPSFNISLVSGGQVGFTGFSAVQSYSRNLTVH